MIMENGRGLIKALENWAKKVTTGYNEVNVRDLSTSFRDGLAFCAIIHHYRSDLIDFESLSKENIFENNSLAFSVAEKQLGVPALLDAEDMVKYSRPDRLSIITYLSQLRNCFENQNKVNKRPELKRIQSNSSGPPAKVPVVQSSLTSLKRHEVCQVCKHRVFILERLIVDGKLYHTTCFRCSKCNSLLNPGAYVESDVSGMYECSVCLIDEGPESTESSMETSEPLNEQKIDEPVIQPAKPIFLSEKDFTSKESVNFAKSILSEDSSNFRKSNLLLSLPKNSESCSSEVKREIKNRSEISISVKDKINAFESNQLHEKSPSPTVVTSVPKIHQLDLSSDSNEIDYSAVSNRLSSHQSLIASKSPEKTHYKSLSPMNFLAKDLAPKEELSEKNKIGTVSKNLNVKKIDDNCDSISNSNTSSHKVPNVDTKIPLSPFKDLNSDNQNIFSVKTGNESPIKMSRDIFKSSLPPLKLSLPSSVRKEPMACPESEKTLNIPEIKSSYSVTLPRPGIRRSLALMRQSSEIKISSSESNLNNDIKLQNLNKMIRRSSLESNHESSAKVFNDKTSLQTSLKILNRTNSFHEINSQEEKDSKASPKAYTPIYKSLYNTSSLTNSTISSKLNSADSTPKAIADVEYDEENNNFDTRLNSSLNSESSFSVKSKVGAHEVISSTEKTEEDLKIKSAVSIGSEINTTESNEEEYPDDLNPFGEEEGDKEYPDDLNPFGDEEEIICSSEISPEMYDESKNPFASDEDEEGATTLQNTSAYSPKPSPFQDSICSNVSSPSGSLKGTIKKRKAPRPPKVNDIFPKDSADSGIDSSFSSMKSSPSASKKIFQTSSPKVRKNKPAPPPPMAPFSQDSAASIKMTKETDNMKLKSSMQQAEDKQTSKQYKKKKRPAPPVPIPSRRDMKKIPLKEIMQEMKEIEEKQRDYEKQGREIEILIRDRDKDEEPSIEEEEYIMQLFELVNQKNALFRRQAELMYIKRSQRLEEQQCQVEKEIRQLMEKPESEKTDEDRRKEEELTMELIDIVDQRNSIIDSIEMDRRRELEEDHSVQEQLEIKNGDLPITAEIKQKSGKGKKTKAKKEKKKQTEEDSGKGTLKRRKNLFSKRS